MCPYLFSKIRNPVSMSISVISFLFPCGLQVCRFHNPHKFNAGSLTLGVLLLFVLGSGLEVLRARTALDSKCRVPQSAV